MKVPAKPLQRRAFIQSSAASLACFPYGAGAAIDRLDGVENGVLRAATNIAKGASRRLAVLLPQGSEANVAPIAKLFERETGVGVDLIPTGLDDVNSELLMDRLLGEGRYDVALPATYSLTELVSADAIASLNDLVTRFETPGFRDSLLYDVGDKTSGNTYGYQTDGDVYVMFYNRLFLQDERLRSGYEDAFGAPFSTPMTWKQLDAQMAFFHAPDKGRYGGLLYRNPAYLTWEWWIRFHAKGVWPLSLDMVPQVHSEAGICALEEMIRASAFLLPETASLGFAENSKRFSKGDVFSCIGWGGTQKILNNASSKVKGNLLHALVPGGDIAQQTFDLSYFNWGWSYVVCASSPQQELAYLFALFASGPKASTIAVRQADGFFDPTRQEHYEDAGIIDVYTKPFLDVHKTALQRSMPDFYVMGRSEYFAALSEGLEQAFHGEMDAQTALEQVSQRWRLITSRLGWRGQAQDWQNLRRRYPRHLQRVLRDL